jgi:hypothetical protein
MSLSHLAVHALIMVAPMLMLLSGTGIGAAESEDFRIETNVYADNEPEPASQTITLFASGVVYDFVEQPQQIAVYRQSSDSRVGQFILLDPVRNQRTEISTERVSQFMEKLRHWAGQQEDELLKFSARPVFEETFDQKTGELNLTHPIWSYQVATVPADQPDVAARYREFSDWYARLNTMMQGTPPPYPRLKLNETLQRHGVLPVEIRRTLSVDSAKLRATHLFSWRLSREDRQRLDKANRYLASFQKVDNEAFLAGRSGQRKPVVRGQSR